MKTLKYLIESLFIQLFFLIFKIIGYKKAYNYANSLRNNILRKLLIYGKKANDLKNTVDFILNRKF